jgi:hypothetical protein
MGMVLSAANGEFTTNAALEGAGLYWQFKNNESRFETLKTGPEI